MAGNLLVGQSGGPTAVINGSLAGVVREAQASQEIGKVLGMRRGIEGMLEGQVVDLTDLSSQALDTLARTPGSALGACRRKISDEEANLLIETFRERDIRYLCYIGGNDSADTTHRLASASRRAGYELAAIAVPKTIDNDLPETDHCPGFGSIARYVATAVLESTLDTRSLPTSYPVKVIEIMGRDAGWVAAAATLASPNPDFGPHLVYVPESAFDRDSFLKSVAEIHRDLGYVVVVAAETIRDRAGDPVAQGTATMDSFNHPIVRGTAESLVRLVEDGLGLVARFDRPGTLQRSSVALRSAVDLEEACLVGGAAVKAALEGSSDIMITLDRISDEPYEVRTSSASLESVANRIRRLPPEYMDVERGLVTDAFRRYAMPLLGSDPFPDIALL